MSSGNPHKRLDDLERSFRRIELKVNRLETEIGRPREDHETSRGPQQTSAQQSDGAPRESPARPEIQSSPGYSARPRSPWFKSPKRWKTILELVGIPFAIGYAVVTFFEWRDLRRNFEAEQRAWVQLGVTWPPIDTKQVSTVNVRFKNLGKSPITTLYSDARFELVSAKDPPSFSSGQGHNHIDLSTIFPGDSSDYGVELFDDHTGKPRAFSEDDVESVEGGKSYLAIYGYVLYGDQFEPHWVRYCFWIGYPRNTAWFDSKSCVDWNRYGDGKPDIPLELPNYR